MSLRTVTSRVFVLCVIAFLSVPAGRAQEQFDPSMIPIIKQYQKLPTMLSAGKYAEALAILNRIIPALEKAAKENEENRELKRAVENCYYFKGLALMELGRHEPAVEALRDFVNRYPVSKLVPQARILWAEGHAAQGEWEEVIQVCEPMVGDRLLNRDIRLIVNQLLGEAHFTLEQWKKAIPPLHYVYEHAGEAEVHMDAAVAITVSLVRLAEFVKLYEWVPRIYQTPARYDIGLNIALIEEGDRQFDEQRPDRALLLYRLVYFKTELIEQLGERVKDTERLIKKPIATGSGEALRRASALKRRLRRVLKSYQEQLKEIQEFPDYDEELMVRIATSYFDLERYLNALQVYRGIYEDFEGKPIAERALYSAFSTALVMRDDERAFAEAEEYIEVFPDGEYFDMLTIGAVQLHMQREEFAEALAIAQHALAMSPDHSLKAQLLYMVAYNHFQLEQLEEAVAHFDQVVVDYPEGGYRQAAEYWRAMSRLFMGDYTAARENFEEFLGRYTTGPFTQDASYRRGVAQYGEGDFESAAETFNAHLERFPNSPQEAETYGMLGDITASWGQLDAALDYYKRAPAVAVNLVQVNYATFQMARTYELEQHFEEIIELFKKYLEEWGVQGNFTEAAYWIGNAQHRMGDVKAAMNTFFDAIVKYGNNPRNYGIDAIIRDVVAEQENLVGRPEYSAFLERLLGELSTAREQKRRTLDLRMRALFARSAPSPEMRSRMAGSLLREDHIPYAGPISLVVMAEEAEAQGRLDFCHKVYEHFLAEYPDSDLALSALRGTAKLHIRDKKYGAAEPLLRDIATRFPQLEDAGWAETRLGDIYRLRGEYDRAIESFQIVLSVKEWRGESWAEALYGVGMCHMEKGSVDEAFAFFQRVYVMYEGYTDWAAKSYIKSGECLERLNRTAEAVSTYEEMLGNKEMADTPYAKTARQNLIRLRNKT